VSASSSSGAVAAPGRGRVLLGLVLAMGLAAMDTTIVATAIPSIVRDLGGFSLFAWVFSIYVLVQAVSVPIYGKLADLYGRKPLLLVGTVTFLVGSALSGISWNMVSLIVFRGVQGIGAGALVPIIFTVVGDLYTIQERARIQGWLSSVWGISAVIGPAIGGFFVEFASWRWIFYINVPLGLFAIFMIVTSLREKVERRPHRVDYLGASLLTVGVGLLIFATLEGGVGWPWLSPQTVVLLLVAALALAGFVWQERRAAEPTLPLWVFTRRLILGSNLATFALGLLSIGLTTTLPTFAQGVMRTDAVVAGFILAVMSLSWPIAAAFSGRFYLRMGFRDASLVGAGLTVCAGLIFVALPADASPWLATLGSLVMGAGLGLLSVPLVVGIQSVVGWNRRGVVTGSNMFARQLGQAVGAAIFGGILNAALASWLQRAPSAFAAQLPANVNDVSNALGGSSSLSEAALAYLRQGLYVASHQVFIALTLVAVGGVLVLLWTPRRFDTLTFPEEEREAAPETQPQVELPA
jgi:EmrB/QacA subfamily drug resistance transporter